MSCIRTYSILCLVAIAGRGELNATKVERSSRAPLGVRQGRDYSIEIYAGPVFTVLSADGDVLAELMTTDEMRAMHPELYRKIEHIYASALIARGGPVLPVEILDVTSVDATITYYPTKD